MENGLEALERLKVFHHFDRCFAQWVSSRDTDGVKSAVALAAALVSLRLRQGDVCIDLRDWAEKPLLQENSAGNPQVFGFKLKEWLDAMRQSQAVHVVNAQDAAGTSTKRRPFPEPAQSPDATPPDFQDAFVPSRPLVLEGTRLYLARYWFYECDLAWRLSKLAEGWMDISPEMVRRAMPKVFPPVSPNEAVDWQRIAAAVAALKRLCIISGGPGTGKTYTVAGILGLLHQLHSERPPRIILAAPTGKAAARITDSLRQSLASFAHGIAGKDNLPQEALTLHRLLGMRQGRALPRHTPENPLHLDVLIVDEASMIDLPLMAHTVAALPPHARLILLGDKDQLASVEAGNVFSDLCGRLSQKPVYQGLSGPIKSREWIEKLRSATGIELPISPCSNASTHSPLGDCTVFLEKNYRFPPDSPLGRLATGIRAGTLNAEALMGKALATPDTLANEDQARVVCRRIQERELPQAISPLVKDYFQKVACAQDLEEAFRELEAFRILCAVREGPFGVTSINELVETALAQLQRIPIGTRAYKGKPVLIVENDYQAGLFNGDVGLLWPDPKDTSLKAWFHDLDGGFHKVRLSRLPAHETAYAMTVHKAQGSEFSRVLVILPDHDARVLTRELLYTAVTRARQCVEIWAQEGVLQSTLQRVTERRSGLGFRLWGAAP